MGWEHGLLIVGILFIIGAMFSLGRGRKKNAATQTTARDHLARARQTQGVRNELEALMVDLNGMARDLSAQLDAKIIHIEQANREADQRIAQLQALREALDQPLPPHFNRPNATPPPAPTDALPQAIQASPSPAPDPTDHANRRDADPLTHEVYSLADQGLGPSDIAQQLNEHAGKIELILALRTP